MQSGCLPELVPNPDNSSGIYDTVETVSNSGTGAVYEGEQSQPQVIYGGQGKKQWSDGRDYTSAADHSVDDTVLVVRFSTPLACTNAKLPMNMETFASFRCTV
jgi:hypothetical protein